MVNVVSSSTISYESNVKIIAEIGINHSGCLDTAKKMCELAAENGADIIKTQLHIPDKEMSGEAKKLIPSHCNESIYEIMESCSLTIEEEYELKEFVESTNCSYLSTPFSASAAHILGKQFNVEAFKIGSGECNNPSVLDAAASYGKPMIVSTGMNTLRSCKITYEYLVNTYNLEPILMHTTNLYPTPKNLVRLGGITELQAIAGLDNVGLSDHTTDNYACLGAVALGAVILERHFTDTLDREGPDIENSMDPKQLKELRKRVDEMKEMRGGSKVNAMPEEQVVRDFAFATVVATRDIKCGEKLTTENTHPKRPGLGDYSARDHAFIIGKSAAKDIAKESHIMKEHIE